MAVSAGWAKPFDDFDRLSPAGLDDWWSVRRGEVLSVAAEELPFHRRRFADSGFDPGSFKTLDDLRREGEVIGEQDQTKTFLRGRAGGLAPEKSLNELEHGTNGSRRAFRRTTSRAGSPAARCRCR